MPRVSLSRLLILIVSAEFLMGASGCPSNGAPEFNWHPKIYAGDARTQSVVHREDGKVEQILCSSSTFDSMSAMKTAEFANAKKAYFELINQCQTWKSSTAQDAAAHALDFLPDEDEAL